MTLLEGSAARGSAYEGGSTTAYRSYHSGGTGGAPSTSAAAADAERDHHPLPGDQICDALSESCGAERAGDPDRAPPEGRSIYRPHRPYKGFSTSIASSFATSAHARTDCCSMACCGVLQSDRTRYLLTGVAPPSALRRVAIHIVAPCSLFLAAGWCAVYIQDTMINQFFSTLLVLMVLGYCVGDCARGTVKRVQVREDLLWRMREAEAIVRIASEDGVEGDDREVLEEMGGVASLDGVPPQHLAGDGDEHHGVDLGQTRYDMTCAHRLCGCYGSDVTVAEAEPLPEDVCGCMWKCFADLFCGRVCGCFVQFCGCCALAQEAREVERLVPAGRRRVDYVTFEPYVDYYGPIQRLRDAQNSKLWDHYAALSHLSAALLKSLGIILVALFLLSFIGQSGFGIQDVAVLLATLAQAFLILYFVHWRYCRHDLSLDAVVKYFACGFVLTTGLAIFFEMVETVMLQLLVDIVLWIKNVKVQNANEFNGAGSVGEATGGGGSTSSQQSPGLWGSPLPPYSPLGGHGRLLGGQFIGDYLSADFNEDDYTRSFAQDNPGIMIIYLLINAFAMAALIEELCKYFGFAMVEHPDFLSREEMEEAAVARLAMADSQDDDSSHEEGGEAYTPPVVVPGQTVAGGAPPGATVVTGTVVKSGGGDAAPTSGTALLQRLFRGNPYTEREEPLDAAVPDETWTPEQGGNVGKRSLNSIGSGITVAMVSVALGFACCENLIYIFVYNGSSLSNEVAVLIARSLFPVHPLAAAIQSIGVCKRDLEGDKRHRLGRIILPAILMHGTFDFVLMLASYLVALNDENEHFGSMAENTSFFITLCIVAAGMAYYVVESRLQKKRLKDLQARRDAVGDARLV